MRLLILTVLSNFYKGLSTDLALDPHEFLFWLTQSSIFSIDRKHFVRCCSFERFLLKRLGQCSDEGKCLIFQDQPAVD